LTGIEKCWACRSCIRLTRRWPISRMRRHSGLHGSATTRPIIASRLSNYPASPLIPIAIIGCSTSPSNITIDELLGTYARLMGLGIVLVLCTDGVSQTAFYYEDPDRNSVEINVDNYGDCWTSGEHMRTSPEFARNPMGAYVDPDKMIAARKAGASPWELHKRAHVGEFAPAQPYDPRALL
jgi:hypothetical protein